MSDGTKTATKWSLAAIVAVSLFVAGGLADLFTERGGVQVDISTVKTDITRIKLKHDRLYEEVSELRGRFDREFSAMRSDVTWIKDYLQREAKRP